MSLPTFSPPAGPRSTVRAAAGGTTLLGVFGKKPTARVDSGGAVQLLDSNWTLDWWIAADDRIHAPAEEASVRQQRLGAGPVIQTSVRVPGGDVLQRAWAYEDGIILEFENTTSTPVGLTVTIRPYDLAGRPSGPTVQLTPERIRVGDVDVWLQNRARDTVPELDAAIVPLPHKTTTRIFLGSNRALPDRQLPDSAAAVRSWDRLVTDQMRIVLPDDGMTTMFDQSRGRLALATHSLTDRVSDLDSSAGSELAALSLGGFRREAVEVLRSLLADRWHPRSLKRSEDRRSAAELVDGLSWAITLYAPSWAAEFVAGATQLTSSVAKRGSDPQRVHAERGLARLAFSMGDPEGSREIDARFGFAAAGPISTLADLRTHAQAASETGSWGNDDVGPAAAAVRSLRPLVLSEALTEDQPQIDLFPAGFPVGWRGGSLELHAIPTAFGDLSAAIRWHGARPALLWQFDRADHVGRPVEVRCRPLDPKWVTTDRRGETLLTGSATELNAPPAEGQSFS